MTVLKKNLPYYLFGGEMTHWNGNFVILAAGDPQFNDVAKVHKLCTTLMVLVFGTQCASPFPRIL